MRVSGTPVPISGWNMIPTCYGCMFLGDDDLMCKGYDSVWATGMSAVILTPSAERMENLCSKMVNDPKRQSPGIVPVPLISVAGEFVDIPEPGQVGAYNVGLVTLPEEESQVAEFKALFISAKLLQQGDPWYAKLRTDKFVKERRVYVLRSEKEVQKDCRDVVDAILKGPKRVVRDFPDYEKIRRV